MLREVRYGARQLKRRTAASAVIILLICISVGSNTVVFSLIDQLLLKPLPVRDPQGLFIFEKIQGLGVRADHLFTYVEFEQVLQRKDLFASAAAEQAWDTWNLVPLDGRGSDGLLVSTQIVSPDYFSDLGISPIIGRVPSKSDLAVSDIPVVLSYRFWKLGFGGARDVVGRTIHLKKHPLTVVGVLPREFHGIDIDHDPDVLLPISAAPLLMGYAVADGAISGPPNFEILVRLAPHVSPEQAASAIVRQMTEAIEGAWILWNSKQAHPIQQDSLRASIRYMVNYRVALRPAGSGLSQLRTGVAQPLKLLMASVLLLFIVVCANIAGLLSATLEERRKEMAVRLSLGATQKTIVQQQILESLILALPGVVGGIGIALALSPVIARVLAKQGGVGLDFEPRLLLMTPDFGVVLFTATISALSVFAFGMTAAGLGRRINLSSALKGTVSTTRRQALQPVFGALQFASALVLLYAAFIRLHNDPDVRES
jgi:ABC-type antimicrobial peptide transport system permease subunit